MATAAKENVVKRFLEDEMRESFIDYSMSVIVSRALPDVRDGLKPVHRRILFAMNELGLLPNRPFKKSATVVGDVLGKYHPHGDTAVYDSLVRMVQDFSLRYPLVDGQGNFGSVDGDSAAAYRYTEARLTNIAIELLADINKDTVNFVPNFDDRLKEPSVLPSRFPNMLVNGSSGIAVGMATNIPPHNLTEIIDGLTKLIDKPELSIKQLHNIVSGPDFPTGGYIYGRKGIKDAYNTGRGRVVMRATASIETKQSGKEAIVITAIPYQVNKTKLIEQIARVVNEKKIEGISDIRDESDRDGMRIVLELRKNSMPKVILNRLYQKTQMQETFGVILLALVDGVPKVMNLKEMMENFIKHRHEVVTRRTQYELARCEERAHILEGLKIALDHIDEVVAIIKKAKDVNIARAALMKKFKLSEVQAQSILDMRLARLTGLERKKIEDEYKELLKLISKLKSILRSRQLRMQLIKDDLTELKEKYGDERRTEIVDETGEVTVEDLIAEEDMVITITHSGYIKRLPITSYRNQKRGGRGVSGMDVREDDFIENIFIATTHEYILFFTQNGRCHWLKVHEIPQASRTARGKSIVNLLEVTSGDQIAAFLPVRKFDDEHHIVMATSKGVIKKTVLSEFGHPRRGGINAIKIGKDDELIETLLTDGSHDIILATSAGMAIRFHENQVRDMGRTAAGVRGITLGKKDKVVGMVAIKRAGTLMVVSEKGYGKRTKISEYRVTSRGGKGIVTLKVSKKTGNLIDIKEVVDTDELMLITSKGIVIRLKAKGIKAIGRNTQGVRMINLGGKDKVVDVARIATHQEKEINGEKMGK